MNKMLTLDEALAAARQLPPEKQAMAVEFIEELASSASLYVFEADERSIVEAAVARAKRGEFADDADVAALLDRPWN